MATFHRFEDIEAWQMAHELTRDIYRLSGTGEFKRDLGMKDQICRASVSIMNNIAEGFERGTKKDFAKFLYISRGSTGEVRSILYVARDLGYISEAEFEAGRELCSRIAAALWALIKHLQQPAP